MFREVLLNLKKPKIFYSKKFAVLAQVETLKVVIEDIETEIEDSLDSGLRSYQDNLAYLTDRKLSVFGRNESSGCFIEKSNMNSRSNFSKRNP